MWTAVYSYRTLLCNWMMKLGVHQHGKEVSKNLRHAVFFFLFLFFESALLLITLKTMGKLPPTTTFSGATTDCGRKLENMRRIIKAAHISAILDL